MSTLREQMSRDLELKGYSPSTQKAYISSVKQYAKYYGKSPDELREEEIRSYLHYLQVDKKVSDSFLHTTYSGLKFFYETTLGMEWDLKRIPRSKKSKRLPYVLDVTEINETERVIFVCPICNKGHMVKKEELISQKGFDAKNKYHVIWGKAG